MTSSQKLQNRGTVDIRKVSGKFIIEERRKLEKARLFVETALSGIVGIVFLGSFLLFIMPEIQLIENYSGVSLSAVLVGLAISLYAFATRGYKPQAGFDKAKNQFWMCKLNSRGHARIVTYYSRTDIQGIFIRRPSTGSKDAALCARIRGKLVPMTLIRGSLVDIEEAHRELCEVLHGVNSAPAGQAVLKGNSRATRSPRGADVA